MKLRIISESKLCIERLKLELQVANSFLDSIFCHLSNADSKECTASNQVRKAVDMAISELEGSISSIEATITPEMVRYAAFGIRQ